MMAYYFPTETTCDFLPAPNIDGNDIEDIIMVDGAKPLSSPSEPFGRLDESLSGDHGPSVWPEPAVASKTAYASDDDWEKHRSEIEELYLRQKMKLHQVKANMADKHGFIAT